MNLITIFFSIHDREYLWKLFYPSDYQPMVPTKTPEVGEYRMYRSFEFRMNILAQATNDVLFTKNSVSNQRFFSKIVKGSGTRPIVKNCVVSFENCEKIASFL